MLHEFIALNRDVILARTRERVAGRNWPTVSEHELEHGVPLFLTQLTETLRLEETATPFPEDAIGASATRHGEELLQLGCTISQVVHDYGDICQAITGLAVDQQAPVTAAEFQTLNRTLDTAIAEATTEHARITAQKQSDEEIEHLGHAAHELRDNLNSAILSFHALKRGDVAINGSTGAVLGRSLMGLRDVIDRTLSEVRLGAGTQRSERMQVATLLDEIGATGVLHAEYRKIEFVVEPVDPLLAIKGDPQLVASAIMNLLHNAFKNTPSGGRVMLRARGDNGQLVVEVEDRCGGFPEDKGDLFKVFGQRGGHDRSGLGLGLSIARRAMRAHEGDVHVRNLPGTGCIFTIELPLAESPRREPIAT